MTNGLSTLKLACTSWYFEYWLYKSKYNEIQTWPLDCPQDRSNKLDVSKELVMISEHFLYLNTDIFLSNRFDLSL